jgi:hypothetical protein|nr:HNH endonuclease [uncultured Sutterella sp.]
MIVIETASFDIQKIKNTTVEGTDYQQGDLLGFWNVLLNVHHLESRQTGDDALYNLITFCKTCHKACHAGKIKLKVKRAIVQGGSLHGHHALDIARSRAQGASRLAC